SGRERGRSSGGRLSPALHSQRFESDRRSVSKKGLEEGGREGFRFSFAALEPAERPPSPRLVSPATPASRGCGHETRGSEHAARPLVLSPQTRGWFESLISHEHGLSRFGLSGCSE